MFVKLIGMQIADGEKRVPSIQFQLPPLDGRRATFRNLTERNKSLFVIDCISVTNNYYYYMNDIQTCLEIWRTQSGTCTHVFISFLEGLFQKLIEPWLLTGNLNFLKAEKKKFEIKTVGDFSSSLGREQVRKLKIECLEWRKWNPTHQVFYHVSPGTNPEAPEDPFGRTIWMPSSGTSSSQGWKLSRRFAENRYLSIKNPTTQILPVFSQTRINYDIRRELDGIWRRIPDEHRNPCEIPWESEGFLTIRNDSVTTINKFEQKNKSNELWWP